MVHVGLHAGFHVGFHVEFHAGLGVGSVPVNRFAALYVLVCRPRNLSEATTKTSTSYHGDHGGCVYSEECGHQYKTYPVAGRRYQSSTMSYCMTSHSVNATFRYRAAVLVRQQKDEAAS